MDAPNPCDNIQMFPYGCEIAYIPLYCLDGGVRADAAAPPQHVCDDYCPFEVGPWCFVGQSSDDGGVVSLMCISPTCRD